MKKMSRRRDARRERIALPPAPKGRRRGRGKMMEKDRGRPYARESPLHR